ncbi:MAG: response regulator [Promethearchaeota archaeon]
MVDDDRDVLQFIKDILKIKFPTMTVETATNGMEAIYIMEENPPNIVITDMKMPVMDGANLCREIRKTSNKTSIALMTAFNRVDGCFDRIFFKPINLNELFAFITRCLNGI